MDKLKVYLTDIEEMKYYVCTEYGIIIFTKSDDLLDYIEGKEYIMCLNSIRELPYSRKGFN